MPAYPVSNASDIMEMIFMEHEDDPGDIQCQDAADAGYLVARGEAVVLRVGNLPAVHLTVRIEDQDAWREIFEEDEEAGVDRTLCDPDCHQGSHTATCQAYDLAYPEERTDAGDE